MRIHIETNNAAFDGENWNQEAARILSALANKIRNGEISDSMILRDFNGNTVGHCDAEKEETNEENQNVY